MANTYQQKFYPPKNNASRYSDTPYGLAGAEDSLNSLADMLEKRRTGRAKMRGALILKALENRLSARQEQEKDKRTFEREKALKQMDQDFKAQHEKKKSRKVPVPSDIMAAALRAGKIPKAAKNIKDGKGQLTPMSQFFSAMGPEDEAAFLAGNAKKYGYVPDQEMDDAEPVAQHGGLMGAIGNMFGGDQADATPSIRKIMTYKPGPDIEFASEQPAVEEPDNGGE